jgi:hypothetical protein
MTQRLLALLVVTAEIFLAGCDRRLPSSPEVKTATAQKRQGSAVG